MKRNLKRLLAVLVAGMMIAFAAVPAAAVTNKTIYVETDMNFRMGPGTNYMVMGSVPQGAYVEILGTYSDWTRVRYNGQVGWIHSGNFVNEPTTPSTPVTPSTPSTGQRTLAAELNLRTGPGTTYMIIDVVPYGTKVNILEVSGTWGRISYNGQSGWISMNFFASYGAPTPPVPTSVSFPTASTPGETWTVKVDDGYLALRTAKAFKYENEIGKLYTGQTVRVTEKASGDYWIVYAPTLGKGGYVNKNYLVKETSGGGSQTTTMTVKVDDGYLALRTAKAFEYENEIGRLWTGDKVEVISKDAGTYWYVYVPKLGKKGYVNRNFLY